MADEGNTTPIRFLIRDRDLQVGQMLRFRRPGPRRYKHIVLDEGQDFSPEMLRSLVGAIPADGSLTFFGDAAQQIYGRRISWRDAGLQVPGPVWFKKNYRNTKEIADLGLAIAAMPYYADEPDMVAPDEFRAAGPKPTLVRFPTEDAETSFIVQQARAARSASASRCCSELLLSAGLDAGAFSIVETILMLGNTRLLTAPFVAYIGNGASV
jgi:superfamily I DNA/RNA helicase